MKPLDIFNKWKVTVLIKKYGDIIAAIVIIVYSILLYISTFSMRTLAIATLGPGFIPRIVATGLFIFSILLFFRGLKTVKSIPASQEARTRLQFRDFSAVLSIVLIFIYISLLRPLGFIISSTLFLFFQILITSSTTDKKKVLTYLAMSIVLSPLIYYLFTEVFQLKLPAGILG